MASSKFSCSPQECLDPGLAWQSPGMFMCLSLPLPRQPCAVRVSVTNLSAPPFPSFPKERPLDTTVTSSPTSLAPPPTVLSPSRFCSEQCLSPSILAWAQCSLPSCLPDVLSQGIPPPGHLSQSKPSLPSHDLAHPGPLLTCCLLCDPGCSHSHSWASLTACHHKHLDTIQVAPGLESGLGFGRVGAHMNPCLP